MMIDALLLHIAHIFAFFLNEMRFMRMWFDGDWGIFFYSQSFKGRENFFSVEEKIGFTFEVVETLEIKLALWVGRFLWQYHPKFIYADWLHKFIELSLFMFSFHSALIFHFFI